MQMYMYIVVYTVNKNFSDLNNSSSKINTIKVKRCIFGSFMVYTSWKEIAKSFRRYY